tara:strand:+ start:833 stop:1573 length:741 start_codon:yes stop_codon:yes gene_type:complete
MPILITTRFKLKIFVKSLILPVFLLGIASCAGFDGNLNNLLTNSKTAGTASQEKTTTTKVLEEKIQNIEKELENIKKDIENLRPNVKELTAIDEDIRKLLTQLSKTTNPPGKKPELQKSQQSSQSKISNTKSPQINNDIKKPKEPISLTPKKPEKVSTEKQLGIHLASFRKIELARKGWKTIVKENGDLLIGLDYRLSPIKIKKNNTTFYRLKAGPFIDKTSADETCKILVQKKKFCKISDFSGVQ